MLILLNTNDEVLQIKVMNDVQLVIYPVQELLIGFMLPMQKNNMIYILTYMLNQSD
jgi:hypothetical protein